TPFSFVFNPDGAKIFVMGSNGDDINSYTLSTAYDVSTAVFDGEEERLPVNSFDTSPFGLAFSPDGTKMFVVGASTDAIYEFNLFDIAPEIDGTVADQEVNDRSTIAPFADILITEGNNQAVTATITLDDNAKGVLSGADLTGTGPYTVAATTSDLLQTILRNLIFDPTDDRVSSGSTETTTFTLAISDGNLIANNTETTVITSTDPNVESIVLVGDPGRFDTTIDFIVTFGENVTGVNVSDFTLNTSEFITASLSGVSGSDNLYTVTVASISGDGIISINLNESGTGIQDGAGNQVIGGFESRDYHIAGFAYDIANAVYLGVEEGLNVGNQEGNPHDLVFTPDGLKMFLLGSSGDDINQYNLSSAYDVSTAVFDATGTFSVRAQESNPYGLAFNNDGTKMFIVGETSDFISQYTLSVPYDVLSATFDGDSERFSVAGQEASPSDLAFNHDGTKLFVLGFSSDVINQYTLTSPYDVSTSVFDGVDERFFVNGQESTPRSFTFSIDGMEVFVMGNSGDDINSYTLASAYDISTAVFNGNDERFSVNLQDPSPYGLTFKPDGTKMFVVGASTDFVYEYVLKDVAPEIEGVLVGQEVNDRSSVNPFADIIIIEGNNQNVSATITLDNNAKGILSGDDLTGSGPYAIAAATATEMQDILRSIAFNPTDDRVTSGFPEITRFTLVINDGTFTTSNNSTTTITTTDPKVSNIVLANSPDQFDTTVDFIVTFGEDVTGVDISDFILNSSENVSSSLAGINGSGNEYIITVESISGDGVIDIDLLTTGTDIQDGGGNSIIGGFNAGEYHYSGYSYDVSNAIYAGIDEGLFVGSQESTPTSIQFNTDGTKMFLIGSSGDEVNQYRLASAYDISTAVYDNITFSLRSQDRTTYGLVFNPEGTKMFVLGATGDNVYQYSVATPFDMSTVTYDGNGELFSCSPQESDPRDLRFSNDGLKLFILGRTFIHSYTLDSPYDVSTALYDGVGERFAVNSQEGSPFSLNFNLDGTKLYILGNSNRQVISYTLAEAFDVSTATFDGNDERLNVNGQASNSLGLTFKPDGTKMYVMDNSSNYIYEYDLANIVPELVNPIVRIEAFEDDNFNFEVPENTFRDLNLSTELRYEASLESGGGLPGWLTYDDISNTFSGTPTNDDVATFSVELTAFDDLGTSAIDIFELEVVNVNDVPTLTPIADQITNEGQVVSFSTSVSDVDVGDTFTWTVDQLSRNKGVTVFNSGEVSWKPGEDYDGLNDVTVTVTDAGGLSASQSLTITVNEVNNAPTISRIGDKEVVESNTLAFTVIARDRDPVEQIIAYSIDASSTGKGMSIDAATGAFSWTVDNQDVGFHDVTVEVTDGDLTASEIFTIRVREENIAPVLTTIGNRTVNAFTPLSFTVTATDANADESFIFSLETTSSLPNSISFNEITGEFNWTPRQVGTYEITISVSDGIASDSEAFTIEVQEPLSTELETKQEVTIFPNPVQRDLQININGPDMGWLSIQLYNLNGQVVLERNVQKTEQLIELTLDITGLNSGVYVLKTKVGSTESTPVNVIKVD
ncbi:putative Ig domain-containing protein, partial [Ekhidna sp.]